MKLSAVICSILIAVFAAGTSRTVSVSAAYAADRRIKWQDALKQTPAWYATADATRMADNVILFQRESGGWPKNVEMAVILSQQERGQIIKEKRADDSTIDNGATYTQLNFLARVYSATSTPRFEDSFLKGVDYLLKSQYESSTKSKPTDPSSAAEIALSNTASRRSKTSDATDIAGTRMRRRSFSTRLIPHG